MEMERLLISPTADVVAFLSEQGLVDAIGAEGPDLHLIFAATAPG